MNPEMAEEDGCRVHVLSSVSLRVPATSQQAWGVPVPTLYYTIGRGGLISDVRNMEKGWFRYTHQGLHCQGAKGNLIQPNSHLLSVSGPLLHSAKVIYSRSI